MSNKKTLKEVFEFFSDAEWIAENENGMIVVTFSKQRPTQEACIGHWMDLGKFMTIYRFIEIQWPDNLGTWDKRCVSREEIMEES